MQKDKSIDNNKKEVIKLMKEAVMSYRIIELKQCLRMFDIRSGQMRKAELQKEVLANIDNLKRLKRNIPPNFLMKFLEMERRSKSKCKRGGRRRTGVTSWRKRVIFGESPFFSTVDVLARFQRLTSYCCMTLSISPKSIQLLRKKKSQRDPYTHEIQFQFRLADENEMWIPKTIRLRVNEGKCMEFCNSPPIIYVTSYCRIEKNVPNSIEVELPDNEQILTLVVSVVRRLSPSQLLDMCPVKKAYKVRQLLIDYFKETGEHTYNVSLICPFEKKIMTCPCRTTICKHPDVFDLLYFLERIQYFLFWKCPVCHCPITYSLLEMEMFFKSYLDAGKLNFTFYKKIEQDSRVIRVFTLD